MAGRLAGRLGPPIFWHAKKVGGPFHAPFHPQDAVPQVVQIGSDFRSCATVKGSDRRPDLDRNSLLAYDLWSSSSECGRPFSDQPT